jgi:hypothetical protein
LLRDEKRICFPALGKLLPTQEVTMLGDQLGETKGKRIVRRVVATEPPTMEVSFEDKGQMLGVPVSGVGTYTSVLRPDGSIHGEGQGMMLSQDGEGVTWTGTGLGTIGTAGSVSYRGMLFYRTNSQKFARLNNCSAAFEYEVDGDGNTIARVWEWKQSGAAKGKSA